MWTNFKEMLMDLCASKKAMAAAAGVIVAVAGRLGLDIPETLVNQVLGVIAAYIIGQGIADVGKHAMFPDRD